MHWKMDCWQWVEIYPKKRLLLAYKSGIFPWFEDEIPLWWSPSPRFVLFPEKLRITHSMKQLLKKETFQFVYNQHFSEVIENCKSISRNGQDGTWITKEMQNAYIHLHEKGFAISGETYSNGRLVGGLYGIKLGNMFFGESMFASESNASKFAFIHLIQLLQEQGVKLIDCQVYTPHLESLGAEMISRQLFKYYLKTEITI